MSERIITFGEATREAMLEEMRADERVFVYGEDIAKQGGIFGQFAGMKDEFPERVLDTPISETALVGAKPVIDLHFADFIGIAWTRCSTRWPRRTTCSADRPPCRWCCARPTA